MDGPPDTELDAYMAVSSKQGVSPRWPFASVPRCPRYYSSVSLLGTAGNTAIDPGLDKRLLEQWQSTDLWPATGEQDTSIAGAPGDPRHFMGFCPEVATTPSASSHQASTVTPTKQMPPQLAGG